MDELLVEVYSDEAFQSGRQQAERRGRQSEHPVKWGVSFLKGAV